MRSCISGTSNAALGSSAGYALTTGSNNTAIGTNALRYADVNFYNTAVGAVSLYNIAGSTSASNVAVGYNAGRFQADATKALATALQSVYIGASACGYDNTDSNTIVIGYNARGIGPNSVVLGNDSIVTTVLKGKVGIGVTSPTNELSFSGQAARKIWCERHTTANTAGNTLTIQGGGATASATDKAGGQVVIIPGLSTGTGESGITLQGCLAGGSGTSDGTLQDMIKVLGNKLGFYNATPVAKAAHIADATDAASALTRINAILVVLENLGLVATS